jgi:hypothetical protein
MKIIIWGHKLYSHTHSYIHYAYYKAFKALGFETYWLDHKDNLRGVIFKDCLFLTEGQAHQGIPLSPNSFYVLHHCDLEKYYNAKCNKIINLCNYVSDCQIGKSFNYTNGKVERLTYFSFFDNENKALYQPWGTDLLPHEIRYDYMSIDDKNKCIYYVGSITQDNINEINLFAKACSKNNKRFINIVSNAMPFYPNYSLYEKINAKIKNKICNFKSCIFGIPNISDEKMRLFIQKSYIAPDIRCEHHVKVGYIPCRIFKNISYGHLPGTNSEHVSEFFGIGLRLPYSENTFDLFEKNVNCIKTASSQNLYYNLRNEIKQNHTYITRVNTILKIIKEKYYYSGN